MQKTIKNYYPQKYGMIYLLFDIAFLFYLIAFFVYYHDEPGYEIIRMVASLIIVILGVLVCLITKHKSINIYNIWYLLFILFCFFSLLWAKDESQVTSVLTSMVRIFILGIFLTARIKEQRDVENLFSFFLISVIYLDLFVGKLMIDFYSSHLFYLHRFGDNFAYNSNSTAILNVISVLIIIHKLKDNKSLRQKALLIAVLFFCIVVILLTGSKKGLLGLMFGVFLLLFQKIKGVKKLEWIVMSLILVVALVQLVLNVPFLYETVGHRIDDLMNLFLGTGESDISSNNRLKLIEYALQLWGEHPILGVGLNNFSIYQSIGESGYYSHNNFVELLADLGIIGFLLYYSLPIKLLFMKIDTNFDLQVLLKTIIGVMFFFDLASISYQDIRIQLFMCLAFLVFHKNLNKNLV